MASILSPLSLLFELSVPPVSRDNSDKGYSYLAKRKANVAQPRLPALKIVVQTG